MGTNEQSPPMPKLEPTANDDDDAIRVVEPLQAVESRSPLFTSNFDVDDEPSTTTAPPIERIEDEGLPVDRGMAWLILLCSFVMGVFTLGMVFSLGSYFKFLEDHFHATKGEVTVLYAEFGLTFAVSVVSSNMASNPSIGYRTVLSAGAIITGCGWLCAYFATHLWHIYIFVGLFTSVGYGVVYAPSLGILGHYFDRYKYFATSLCTVGSAAGVFIFPPYITFISQRFGWQTSMLLNTGQCIVILMLAQFYRNPKAARDGAQLAASSGSAICSLVQNVNLHLFLDLRFSAMFVHALFGSAYGIIIVYIVRYAEAKFEADPMSATYTLALYGIGNTSGRIFNSIVNARPSIAEQYWKRLRVAEAASLVLTISHWAVCQFETLEMVQANCIIIGFAWGLILSSWPGILMECFGRKMLTVTWGMLLLACALFRLGILPLAGYVIDQTKSFRGAFYMAAVCQLVGLAALVVVDIQQMRHSRREMERLSRDADSVDDNNLEMTAPVSKHNRQHGPDTESEPTVHVKV